MVKTPLINLLNSFSADESRRFIEYISSPFFNKNEKVVKLYRQIIKAGGNPAKLEKEYVYKKIVRDKTYNDSSMRSLIFTLTHLAEEYLGYINYMQKADINIVRELNARHLDKSFEKKMKLAEGKLENIKNLNVEDYYSKYVLSAEQVIYNSRNSRYLTVKDKPGKDMMKFNDYLVIFFIKSMIANYTLLVHMETTVSLPVSLKKLERVMGILKESLSEDMPEFILDLKMLKLLMEGKEEDYFELKRLLMEKPEISEDLGGNLITLLNYCIAKSYAVDKFNKEAFDIVKLVLKFKVHAARGGYMPPLMYKNFVIPALRLKEYEWAEKFIEDYKSELDPDKKENAYYLSRSNLYFSKGDFKGALESLSRVQNEDIFYKLEIKQILLKIYYELGMYGEAMDLCDTYRHFFPRNSLITEHLSKAAQNFIKFMSKLVKIKTGADKSDIPIMIKQIKETDEIFARQWLLKKLNEIGKLKY